jgi:flagellar M-ring protein FliF
VRTAIGFDRNRGDQVEIVNLRFAEAPAPAELKDESLLSTLFSPTKEDVLRLLEIAVIALLTLIVLFAVVRPLLTRVTERLKADQPAALSAPGEAGTIGNASAPSALPGGATAKLLEAAKMSGQVQAESLDRIGEMVRSNPQEAVAVMRNWLHER